MDKMQKVLIFTIISAVVMLILTIFIYMMYTNKQNKKVIRYFNDIYNFLSKRKLFATKLHVIRTRIYNNTLDEDWFIKYKTILYWILSLVIGVMAAIFVVIYFKNNMYVTFTLLFFCYQIKEMILDMLIGNDTAFLESLAEYSIELQQAYTLTKDVRTAILEANNNYDNYNIIKRMEEIEAILDDQMLIDEYLQDCPNEYLKLLIINCSLVSENGDKKDVDGKSVFLENIFYNNENIQTEVFKRKQLEFWLRGMKLVCILPLLLFSPYEWWANKFMSVTDVFYKTNLGFITKILITFISIICFYMIQNLENAYKKKPIKTVQSFWEERFLKNDFIKNCVLMFSPKPGTAKAYRYNRLISDSGEYTRVEYIFLRKLLCAIGGFIIVFSICYSIHKLNVANILNNEKANFMSTIVVTDEGQEDSLNFENELLQYVDIDDIDSSYDILIARLNENGITSNLSGMAEKIIGKKLALENEGINFIDILLSLFAMFLAYNLPEIVMGMKTKLRKYEMENEIIIFETIILIFMYHENSTSEVILEHISKFADIFQVHIDSVLKEIKKSDFEALHLLLEDIKYKPFLNLIKNIIKAENIKTKDAFIALSDNRRNYLMNRREENRRIVHKSVSLGSTLSLVTINLIIMLYIAIPLVYVSFVQLDATQSQIMDIE